MPKTTTASTTTRMIVKYTCSMHPDVVMDKPGKCPICGIKLVKKQYVLDGKAIQTTSIPNEVYGVFKKSCMACHGNGGRKAPSKDAMPPLSFRKANPNSVLTSVQKGLICNWSKTVIASKLNVKINRHETYSKSALVW